MTGYNVLSFAQLAQADRAALDWMHPQDGGLLLWPTRGQGVVNLHGQRRGFSAHHAMFIADRQLWSIELGRQCIGQAIFLPASDASAFPERCQQLRIHQSFTQSELTGLIEDMRREIDEAKALQFEALQARSQLLAIWLRRQMLQQSETGKTTAAERLVEKFCDLASSEHMRGHSMHGFAKKLNVTPTHLTRVCRQCCGLTAGEILTQCLLYAARQELTKGRLSIKDVAAKLGFGSAAYFTRFIQQHFGLTPSGLRKSVTLS